MDLNSQLNNVNVLIVEPSKLYRSVIEQQINSTGLNATFATTANEAVEIVGRESFGLVCCAYELGDSSGIKLIKTLRGIVGESIPLLLMTAYEDKTLLREAVNEGVTEVIYRNRFIELTSYLDRMSSSIEQLEKTPARVLYIEDSKAIAQLTVQVLEKSGITVDLQTNAEGALAKVESGNYDLIITDILLEGSMTGISLIRKVRNLTGILAELPILAMSGLDKSNQKIEALRQGATDFISKPVDYDEMVVRIKNLVRSKRLYEKVLEQENQLRLMAVTDPLTTLYNRHYLVDIGLKRVREAVRQRQSLSVVVVDLDFFKKINDVHGHIAGDDVLKAVGALLNSLCREEDFAVRFGGEEFVLVLPHCAPDSAAEKAELIRQKIIELKPNGMDITASFGVTGIEEGEENSIDFNQMFQQADDAVYVSKESGRNQVNLYRDLTNEQLNLIKK